MATGNRLPYRLIRQYPKWTQADMSLTSANCSVGSHHWSSLNRTPARPCHGHPRAGHPTSSCFLVFPGFAAKHGVGSFHFAIHRPSCGEAWLCSSWSWSQNRGTDGRRFMFFNIQTPIHLPADSLSSQQRRIFFSNI